MLAKIIPFSQGFSTPEGKLSIYPAAPSHCYCPHRHETSDHFIARELEAALQLIERVCSGRAWRGLSLVAGQHVREQRELRLRDFPAPPPALVDTVEVFAGDFAAQHAFGEDARVHHPRAVRLANRRYANLHIDVSVSLAGGQAVARRSRTSASHGR